MGSPRSCCICVGTVDVSVDMDGGYILLRKTSGRSATMRVGLYG